MAGTADALSWKEQALASAALVTLGLLVFGDYIWRGGFNGDDWAWAAIWLYPSEPGFLGAFGDIAVNRPVAALYLTIAQAAFGTTMALHIGLAMLLGILMSAAFYGVLRSLGLERVSSIAIAGLSVVFPFANVTKFWATGGVISLSVLLFFAGLLVAFYGVRSRPRRAVAVHALAVSLYAASLLTYEIAAFGIVLASLGYAFLGGRTAVRWRAATDVVTVGIILLLEGLNKQGSETAAGVQIVVPLADQLRHAKAIATQSVSLFGPSSFPFGFTTEQLHEANNQGPIERPLGVWPIVALVLLLVGTVIVRRRSRDAALRSELRRWLLIAAAAAAGVTASYLIFVPAQSGYVPLAQGINNRTNALAAFGWVTFVFAVSVLAGLLLTAAARLRPRTAPAFALLAAGIVFAGYVRLDRVDLEHWVEAFDRQERAIAAVAESRAPRPPGTTILGLIRESHVAPGVRVFVARHDLLSALRVSLRERELRALPLPAAGSLRCGARSLKFVAPYPELEIAAVPYGRALGIDLDRGGWQLLRTRRECMSFALRHRAMVTDAAGSPSS